MASGPEAQSRGSNSPRPVCSGATLGSIQPPIAPGNSKPPTGAAITGELTSAEVVDEDVDRASTSRQPVDEVAAGKLLREIFDNIFKCTTSAISPLGLRGELVHAIVENEFMAVVINL